MNNPLNQKITIVSLLRFTAPTMLMMIFLSFYTMIDGIFVSRFVSAEGLSAINIVFPIVNFVIAIGIMLATGSSSIIAKQMGEAQYKEARLNFSLIIYLGIFIGIIIAIVVLIFLKPIILFLGANSELYEYCYDYARYIAIFFPMLMLQLLFQYLFVTAGKPIVGLTVTIVGGIVNFILDYIFIINLKMGISGASIATGISYSIPAIYGLLYFTFNRKGTLFLKKLRVDIRVISKTCTNGSSEMVSNLAAAIITFLFNITMMKYVGKYGVAATTIVLYVEFFLNALFIGFASGVAPLISFNYGENNIPALKKILKISSIMIIVASLISFVVANLFSKNLIIFFTVTENEVYEIALRGFPIFLSAFLFSGFNIFASALFTALSNGKISAFLSFIRSFVLIGPFIVILPMFIGVNGIWLAVPIAECIVILISIYAIIKNKKKYKYL